VTADPFRRTAELCALLQCHAGGVRLTAISPSPREATDRRPAVAIA
jgi:hypothetical protein